MFISAAQYIEAVICMHISPFESPLHLGHQSIILLGKYPLEFGKILKIHCILKIEIKCIKYSDRIENDQMNNRRLRSLHIHQKYLTAEHGRI